MVSWATLFQFVLFLSYFSLHCSSENFIFNGFKQASNLLSLDGATKITKDGLLQLTNGKLNIIGHAFFSSRIPMIKTNKNMSVAISFSTSFILDIKVGKVGGHGLTFVIVPSKQLPGAFSGPYLVLLGPNNNGNFSNHVFVVEFDTVKNRKLFNETNGNHIGVDLNNLKSNISQKVGYYSKQTSSKVEFELGSGQPIQSWIDYNGTNKILDIIVAPLSIPKPSRALISYLVDLIHIFKEEMYVGFTSSTKKRTSSHYIIAWSFSTEGSAQTIDISHLPKFPHPPNTMTSSGSKVLKIGILFSIGTLALIALLIGVSLYLRKRAKLVETIEDWEQEHPYRLWFSDKGT